MISNRQKKKRLFTRTFVMTLFMALFTQFAQAQNVYMCDGSRNVGSTKLNFYDSGGASSGPEYYWERWFQRNENYTFTFKPLEEGKKIKVTFKKYTAYLDTGGSNHSIGNEWSLRLNTAVLSVYEGETALESNLIASYTGNMTEEFSIIANGAITFNFESFGYREEGWAAEVEAVDEYTLEKPQISFEVCSDNIVISPNNLGATVYYQLGNQPDPEDPLQGDPTLYEGPFHVDPNTTIYAFAVLNGENSDIASKEFTANDVTPTPGKPTITRTENTITMTPAAVSANVNETYYVWYTTDGSDPDATHGQRYTEAFEWLTPGTTFKAVTRASSCSDKMSEIDLLVFEHVKVPTPTITFANGNATIACSMEDVTIYYTTDGSTPTTSSTQYTAPFPVNYGVTVKALAVKNVSTGYENSEVASAIYVPEGGSGTDENVVILDDREDHSWSYYSDGTQPIHSLKPADIKIIYLGNGTDNNNMTTDDTNDIPTSFGAKATGVKVGVADGETQNTFIYLKTLENADPEGNGTNYPYTMIPNPFQVRPTNGSGTESPTRSVYINTSRSTSWNWGTTYGAGTLTVTYYNANNQQQTYTATIDQNNQPTTTLTVKSGTTVNFSLTRTSSNNSVTYTAYYDNANGEQISTKTANSGTTQTDAVTVHGTVSTDHYRGFYAWRIKSLSNGLTINNKSVGSIVYADEEITFQTANAEDNEVEFEALWAQAYVNSTTYVSNGTDDYANYKNAYERNFKTAFSNHDYPVIFTTIMPDGSGTVGNMSAVDVSCSSDYKFENMNITGGGNVTFTANNHSLIFGRGVSGTVNYIRGTSGNLSNPQYEIRLESGTFNYVSLIRGYWSGTNNNTNTGGTVSGTVSIRSTIGSDYDRAVNETNGPTIVNNMIYGADNTISSDSNISRKTLDVTVKSGRIGSTHQVNNSFNADAYQSLYMSVSNSQTNVGERSLTIEGGEISSVAGGIDDNNQGNNNSGVRSLTVRMRGGTIRGAFYGGAAQSPASGDRHLVFTGGTVKSWLGAGCNGVSDDGGQTYGESFLYVGGNTHVGGGTTVNGSEPGTVFGAGKGYAGGTGTSGEMTFGTNVVIADNAVIENDVYGGGNYGYALVNTDLYVLGGTVQGNVFGGSNRKQGEVINVYMKGGTVVNNVYGGSNTTGTISGLATVNISGGTVTNVFGGGLGASTNMDAGTVVNVSGGTINNNVYGGGEEGTVTGNTNVTVTNGDINDVYGAGKGGNTTAQVSGQTFVNVKGGTIANVYGGGEAGDVMAGDGSGANDGCEYFENQTAVGYNANNGQVPDGWKAYRNNTSNVYVPRVSNSSNYTQITNNDGGNYLLFTAYSNASNYAYAIAPKYENLESVSFRFRLESSSSNRGTLYLGYVTDNSGYSTWQSIATLERTTTWTTYTLTEAQINTINTNNGYLAFRFGNCNRTTYYSAAIDDVCVTTNSPAAAPELASTVTISGGTVEGDVFGGGKLGKTGGSTQVNLENGNIRGSLFGGAYGSTEVVYVAGMHTVNIMGGRVFGSVYGGSRNADDALAFNGSYNTTEDATSSVINISAGQVDNQVYVAGYFGRTYGSVYAFIGKNAILNAPHSMPSFDTINENKYKVGNLHIEHNIWAGADFGDFQGGGFGDPTVSGYSDIYVDGEGYDTDTDDESANTYMAIKGSIYGCGTSCDAGTKGRGIYVSNYGHANESGSKADDFNEPYVDATRSFESIQRADTLVINNSHINFKGQGMVYTTDVTNKYAIVSFDKTVRIVGGSSLFMNAPATQIIDFWSASVDTLYKGVNAVYTVLTVEDLGSIDNKIRVNGGNYIEIYHDKMINNSEPGYGMLNGFAHMMVAASNTDNTCAYARPKWCQETPIESDIDNPSDGGWVSYNSEANTFDINGVSHTDDNYTVGDSVQMPYENHKNITRNGEQFFRIWRAGGKYSEREAVVTATADGSNSFSYVDVTVKLPAWRDASSYYMFQTTGEAPNYNTTIDYGSDVMMFNSAMTGDNAWIHYDVANHAQAEGAISAQQEQISGSPNVNFGLFVMPGTGMNLNEGDDDGLIVCNESDAFLASIDSNAVTVNQFNCNNFEKNPEITLRLTYSNRISTNTTWDPMFITLVQVNENGDVTDIVRIHLIISTATSINQEFITQTYAIMNGTNQPNSQYTAKVVLPSFDLFNYSDENLSEFKITNVEFAAENGGEWINRGASGGYSLTKFAMEVGPATNEDNTNGWDNMAVGMTDTKNIGSNGLVLGNTGARNPFAIDFRLNYKGDILFDGTNPRLGMLTFTIQYTNVKVPTVDGQGNPVLDNQGNPTYHQETKTLTIKVEVIRRGLGKAFYLDGVNGSNANHADFPDKAALALSTIFNRLGFQPGDVVYVVNTVSTGEQTLDWSGTKFDNVTLYRYPGGHPLSQTQKKDAQGNALFIDNETGEETTQSTTNGVDNEPIMIEGEIVDNPDNEAFLGNLAVVNNKGKMNIHDITLDGHMSTHATTAHDGDDPAVIADSALIAVERGGMLTLSNGVMLQENNCTSNGAGVELNGTLRMNDNAKIKNNVTSGDGGGVYMNGTMIVSDSVQIVNNTKGTVENNVFLTSATSMIQIGTAANDGFEELTSDAVIGVTKDLYADVDGYTRVVNVETSNEIPWLDTAYLAQPNDVIYHDGHKYQLVKYTNGSPQILYWIGTWVTVQDHEPTNSEADGGVEWDGIGNITTANQLAWVISLVNGENGCTADNFEGKTIVINNDIDMSYSIWVPIGTTNTNFKGTFDGNGHIITGIKSPLVNDNAAMFGITDGATIENAVVEVNFTGNSSNMGTFVGTMNGGTLDNVEAAGTLEGKENTINLGGLVGLNNDGEIHSSFAVNTMKASVDTTFMGGLVGNNGGDLYNSYANTTMTGSNRMGGLVGVNDGHVENCYAVVEEQEFPAFAHTNNGTITVCYADTPNDYVNTSGNGATLNDHGTYGAVESDIKALGYMYGDNLIIANTNDYVGGEGVTSYLKNHIPVWNGLLSALNQWVRGHQGYTAWNRPLTQGINGDLPILAFSKDNCVGNYTADDGKLLRYSASDKIVDNEQALNGLDTLLYHYNGKAANIYLYQSAVGVKRGSGNANLFIHEDAALIQNSSEPIKATVGVTFDNSCKTAKDYFENNLDYDWHLLSSPLTEAPLGITYNSDQNNWWENEDTGQVSGVSGSYMPDNINGQSDVKWDFYTYFEPEYHWINFKRSSSNHYHYEEPHGPINYTGTEQTGGTLTPGKGYMMAISQDSYLNNIGTLNNDTVEIKLTCSGTLPEQEEYTKDWGSNLIGNPYQAYLDLDKVATETGYDRYYVYIAESNNYVAFKQGQSKNTWSPSRYIHPHQAFFVLTDANDTFTFTYDMATADTTSESYFRKGSHIDYPLINLFVNDEAGAKNYTTIEVGRPELGGAEKTDALKTTDFDMYAHYGQKDYKLLFTPAEAERVAVFFTAKTDGTYTITWDTQNGEFSFLRLIDNITGIECDMLKNDHYTFEAYTTDFASRFYIIFNNPNEEPGGNGNGNDNFAYYDGYGWIVNGEGILQLIDVTGRVLYREYLAGDMNRVHLDNLKTGVYVLQLGDKTQKIIIK